MDLVQALMDFARAMRAGDYERAVELSAVLIKEGLLAWKQWEGGTPVAMVCPCNTDDDNAVADWIELQCKATCSAGGVTAAAVPWNLVLSLLLEVVKRLLDRV